MHRIGIVDLGSNTARLVVFAYEPGRWYRLEDEIREPVRLAEGFGEGSTLTPGAMDRCVTALKLFADFASATGLEEIEVIATSALRDAKNREELLERIRPLALPIKILSGEEEAAWGVRAVANSLDLRDAWVVDLGGGSLEISEMRDRSFHHGASFPLGMVRLTERFLTSDSSSQKKLFRKQAMALEQELESRLAPLLMEMLERPHPIVAMGGTVRNLGRAVQKKASYPLSLLHGYFLQKRPLERLVATLRAMPATERGSVSGIRPDRGDVILAGGLLYQWLIRRTNRKGLILSGQGLREGAFYRHLLPKKHLSDNVRSFAIRNIRAQYSHVKVHTEHVRRLAASAFEGLAPLHKFSHHEAEILDAAANLHDGGSTLSYYRHARHGVYLLGSRPLPGFTHREQALIMLMVKYHEKGTPRISSFEPLLGFKDLAVLRRLTACLRLAEHLERSRSGRILSLEVSKISKRRIEIRLQARVSPTVEIWEAKKLAGPLFREAFGRELHLKVS